MKIADSITVDSIYDLRRGKLAQIILLNRFHEEHFTLATDLMGRQYVKIKLDDVTLLALIQELQKSITKREHEVRKLRIVKESED